MAVRTLAEIRSPADGRRRLAPVGTRVLLVSWQSFACEWAELLDPVPTTARDVDPDMETRVRRLDDAEVETLPTEDLYHPEHGLLLRAEAPITIRLLAADSATAPNQPLLDRDPEARRAGEEM